MGTLISCVCDFVCLSLCVCPRSERKTRKLVYRHIVQCKPSARHAWTLGVRKVSGRRHRVISSAAGRHRSTGRNDCLGRRCDVCTAKPGDKHFASTAPKCFLLVAPAAANRQLFANFTRVVNDFLEQPPFNFTNRHKHLNISKKVSHHFRSVDGKIEALGGFIIPRSRQMIPTSERNRQFSLVYVL